MVQKKSLSFMIKSHLESFLTSFTLRPYSRTEGGIQVWGLGNSSFESSPGDSNVQPRLRITTKRFLNTPSLYASMNYVSMFLRIKKRRSRGRKLQLHGCHRQMLRPIRTGKVEVWVTSLWNEDDRPVPEKGLSTGPTVDSHVPITNTGSGQMGRE